MGREKLFGHRYDDEFYEMIPSSLSQPSFRETAWLESVVEPVEKAEQVDYSDKLWNDDFAHRPSWCDARLSLLQIEHGKAKGNKPALYLRSLLQTFLFNLGCKIQRHSITVILIGLCVLCLFTIGLKDARIETDLDKLWVQKHGRLFEEQKYLQYAAQVQSGVVKLSQRSTEKNNRPHNRQPSQGPTGGSEQFLVLIQTPLLGHKFMNKEDMMIHAETLTQIAQMNITLFNESWSLRDVCFRPAAPHIPDYIKKYLGDILEDLIPCIIITPLDCFWDGSKPLGPFPAVVPNPLLVGFDVFPEQVSWKNLNPLHSLNEVLNIGIPIPALHAVRSLYERANITSGYQQRLCLEPLDIDCPKSAPNHVDICPIVEKFIKYNEQHGNLYDLEEKKANISHEIPTTTEEAPFDEPVIETPCRKYSGVVRRILLKNATLYKAFVPAASTVDIAARLSDGCRGFAERFMRWPDDLIIGGVKRHDERIESFEALESVFMLASAVDVHGRLDANALKPHLNVTWSPHIADRVLMEFQRAFTNVVHAHWRNSPQNRMLHPLAGTSVNDMLEQFSRFNPTVIIIGYVLMIVYASLSLCSFAERGVRSGIGLGFAGCLLVTFAGLAGLGCSMILGIPFNAATTQIVPFLTLGLGVDDMFLLVHSYRDIVKGAKQNEIGFLLKETGLSALLTSINNVLAFLAGGLLPVPALRDFCLQVAILLAFNAIAILTIYPAVMSLDLRRRKERRPDILCCMRVKVQQVVKNKTEPKKPQHALSTITTAATVTNGHTPIGAQEQQQKNNIIGVVENGDSQAQPVVFNLGSTFTKTHLRNISAATTVTTNSELNDVTLANSELNLTQIDNRDRSYLPGGAEGVLNSASDSHRRSRDFSTTRCSPKHWTLHRFVSDFYSYWLSLMPVKLFVIIFNLILLSFGIWGCSRVVLGLELTDVIPKGTAANAFLEARETYFSFYNFNAILKGPIDLASKQDLLRQYRAAISESKFVVKRKGKVQEQFWLDLLRDWLQDLQTKFDMDFKSENVQIDAQLGNVTFRDDAKDETKLALKLMCSFGEQVDCTRGLKERLVDDKGLINRDGFMNYLTAWVNLDPMTYHVSQAAMSPKPFGWAFSDDFANDTEILVPAADNIVMSRIPFFSYGLIDTPSIVEMILEIRAVCDKYDKLGLPNFPEGIAFKFWEQYLTLRWNLIFALVVVIGSVFVVISILLMNPWTSAVVVTVLVLLVVELAGFMGLVGLKLNAVSAVSMITAVGIGVEFTVHVSLSFLTTLGTRDHRMARTLDHMFIPVLHGGLSTLLGVIMLAFSEFEFIVRYFFMVMSALIVLGLLNGLVLLPVLLSVVGPPSEVRTVDGSHYLPPPSPKTVSKTRPIKA